MLETLIERWGYLAVAIGATIEGEVVLVTAGALTRTGMLRFPLVVAAAFASCYLVDQIWFLVGRRWGRPLISRWKRLKKKLAAVRLALGKYGSLYVFGFRFLWGLRTISPLVLGATGYPHSKFAIFDALGCLAWANAITGAGWLFGTALAVLLGRSARLQEAIAGAIVIAIAVALVARKLWLVRESGKTDTWPPPPPPVPGNRG